MMSALEGARQATQLLVLMASHSYLEVFSTHQIYRGPLKSTCVPVLSCHSCPSALFSCPIGTIQHFAALHQVPLFLLGLLGGVGLLVGRMACGWLCPFGLLQDLMYRVRSLKIRLPEQLSVARYAVLLLLVLLIPWVTGETWFSKLCPAGTLTAAIPWALWDPADPLTGAPIIARGSIGGLFALKVAILVGFLVLFVVSKRPFCRLVCPLGLLFSFFNRFSLLRLEVAGSCNRCDSCRELCPVDLKVYEEPNSDRCIRCLKCTGCRHVTLTARPLTSPDSASQLTPGSRLQTRR